LPGLESSLRAALVAHREERLIIPLSRVKPQLPLGRVEMPLGELRRLGPTIWRDAPPQDDLLVPLPLEEILKQVGPEHFQRRAGQRRVSVPEEVIGPFGANGHLINIASPHVAPAPVRAPAPVAPAPMVAAPTAPPAPVVRAEPQKPVSGAALPPLAEVKPVASQPAVRATLPAIKPAAAAGPAPVLPRPLPGMSPSAPARGAAMAPAAPAPAAPSSEGSAAIVPRHPEPAENAPLVVPLSEIGQQWPAVVRSEMISLGLEGASVALPFEVVGEALKTGLIQFAWKQIVDWTQPRPAAAPSAETAATLLELPLPVVAPLFMARVRKSSAQKTIAVASDIPDVFGRNGKNGWNVATQSQASAATPLGHAPGPSTSPVLPASATSVPSTTPAKAPAVSGAGTAIDLNAVLGPPQKRFQAREVVLNLTRLPGVAGVLLAMNDGLLVTSTLPPKIKSEMLAAFLPQMFGRMSQYAREIGMSAVGSLSFSVEEGVWQVLRQSNVFLAVLCRPDQTLPMGPLAAIGAELNKQQQ